MAQDPKTNPQQDASQDAPHPAPPGEPRPQPTTASPDGRQPLGGPGGKPRPDQEKDLWHGSPSALAGAWKLILAALLAAGLIVLNVLTSIPYLSIAIWVVVGLLLAWAILSDLYKPFAHHYRLTTQRLFMRHGLLSHVTDQTELIRVDDVRVRQSLWQRMLGIGDVHILSTDTSDADCLLEDVNGPHQVAEIVRDNTRLLRSSSLFVERL